MVKCFLNFFLHDKKAKRIFSDSSFVIKEKEKTNKSCIASLACLNFAGFSLLLWFSIMILDTAVYRVALLVP